MNRRKGRQPEGAADIEGQVSDAVAEGQQRFHRGEHAVAAGGCQIRQGIGKALEIGEGNRRQGLPCPGREAGDVGGVGALSVRGPAVEPDLEQLGIGVGLGLGQRGGQGFCSGDCQGSTRH